jgi:hypothetical protein
VYRSIPENRKEPDVIYELKDCSEVAEVLQAKPSRAFRVILATLVILFGSAGGWAHMTKVDLVVRAQGRVRPVT